MDRAEGPARATRGAASACLSFLACILVLWACACPRTPADESRQSTVIKGARVFDGASTIDRTNVVLTAGKIAEVAPDAACPPNAEVVDASGLTVLPGFIDAHTHTWQPAHLRQALVFGVTTELDMLTGPDSLRWLKDQLARGVLDDGADLRSAGNGVLAPGGHGTEYGVRFATLSDPAKVDAFVAERVQEGSDYIKIIYDDGTAWEHKTPALSEATVAASIAAAHAHQRLAVVHAATLREARQVVRHAADGLTHLWMGGGDSELASTIRQRGVFVVPTLSAFLAGCRQGIQRELVEDEWLLPYLSNKVRRVLAQKGYLADRPGGCTEVLETVKSLHRHSVVLLVGSDAGNPGTDHGVTLHGELSLLVRAGLSAPEALAAATSLPARVFGLHDRGRIAPGLRADLVLVQGDPTREIQATRRIVAVYRGGKRLDRLEYRRRLVRLAQAEARRPPKGPQRLGDFERVGTVDKGWQQSTDAYRGGSSSATVQVVAGGAKGSRSALSVTGAVAKSHLSYPWAGAVYWPGSGPMQVANLSGSREIVFWAKGDGGRYSVMFFLESRGSIPASQSFVAGAQWAVYRFPFSEAFGTDGSDVKGIFFGAEEPGQFSFEIDGVELQ